MVADPIVVPPDVQAVDFIAAFAGRHKSIIIENEVAYLE